MSTKEDEFVAYVKELRAKLFFGGTFAIVDAIVRIALHVVELRARVAKLEARP
jgi:hypothetical protein